MKDKVNILFIINGLGIGGAERNLYEYVKHLDRRRYHPRVCSVGQGGPLKEDFEKLDVEVVVFPKKHKFDFTLIYKVARYIRKSKVDIVVTILFYADVIGSIAAKLAKVPVIICWAAGSTPRGSKNSGLRHIYSYRIIRYFFDKIVSVSEGTRRFLIKERNIPPNLLTVIHYGVDVEKYKIMNLDQKRRELGVDGRDFVIGVVARLTKQKGHIYLIEAAKEIVKKYPNSKFLLVGDGPLRVMLEKKVAEYNLRDNFIFLGFRDDVNQLLNVMDIFVLPSLWEGLPNVILEAMACGKPVVATAVDGTPEAVIDNETGILVPPKDPQALEEAIVRLLSNSSEMRRLGENSRKRIEEFFSINYQASRFEELYTQLLRKKVSRIYV